MPAWLVPALKAIAPHIGTIISAAKPVFTKKGAAASDPSQLLQQQITELQTAVAENATQMQKTVVALEEAAAIAERKLNRVAAYCVAAGAVSLVGLGLAMGALLRAG
jgi:hypothetical protein